MARYDICVSKTVVHTAWVQVEADTVSDAEAIALAQAERDEVVGWSLYDDEFEAIDGIELSGVAQ